MKNQHRMILLPAVILGLGMAACGAAPDEPGSVIDSEGQAVDNELPPDGTACYVDGPLVDPEHKYKKGKISGQFCCIEGYCIVCSDKSECQTGGSVPGTITATAHWSATSPATTVMVTGSTTTPSKTSVSWSFHKP